MRTALKTWCQRFAAQQTLSRTRYVAYADPNHRAYFWEQRRTYAITPPPKLKNYGTLHSNVRQLLRVVHPDTFRKHMKDDNPNREEYKKLSMINQRSLQALNGYNNTIKNFTSNMNTFLKGNGDRVNIEFHVPKTNSDNTIKTHTVRTSLVYPHVSKQIWVRHADPTKFMFHWRDVQFLDLLHRVETIVGSSDKEASLVPGNQEIDVLRRISRETRIPMPVQFKEPTVTTDTQTHMRHQGHSNIPYEEQKIFEMNKKLMESKVLWQEPSSSNDQYSILRQQNLKESSHPRSPEFHINKKFSVVFDEPSKDQLKKMLSLLQIDFPIGTPNDMIRGVYRFFIEKAKDLKIWEWYHTPIIVGTPNYSLVKHSILGIPIDCTAEKLNRYLEKNLPVVQENGEIFRKRLDIVAEKMLQLEEYLCLLQVKSDPFVTYDQVEACMDHLLENKELLDSYNVTTLKLCVYNKKDVAFFSERSGTIYIPYDLSNKQLREFLEKCKALQTFPNYRIARSSIRHYHLMLKERAKIRYIEVPKDVREDTVAYQRLLGKVVAYVAYFAPYNTLEGLKIKVHNGVKIHYNSEGLLYLPSTFKPFQLHEYFVEQITKAKENMDRGRLAPSTSKLQFSHIPYPMEEPTLRIGSSV